MDNLVKMFQQRDYMDSCGITATLGVSTTKQVVDVSIVSQQTCQMSLSANTLGLSGSNVKMETYGPQSTAWIDLTAGATSSFTLSAALAM